MPKYLTDRCASILLKSIVMETQKEVASTENISVTMVAQIRYDGLRSIRGAYRLSKGRTSRFTSQIVLEDMAKNSSMTTDELLSIIQGYIKDGLSDGGHPYVWERIPCKDEIPTPMELLDFIYEGYCEDIENLRKNPMYYRSKAAQNIPYLTKEMVEVMLKCRYMKTRKQVAVSMRLTPPQVKFLQEKGLMNIRLAYSKSMESEKFQPEAVLKDMAERSDMKPEELAILLEGDIKDGLSSDGDKKYWRRIPCKAGIPTVFELLDFLYLKYDYEIDPFKE